MISVVIPAYNVEEYISDTLNSLIKQSRKDFEVIIVDDGSTDGTVTRAKEVLHNYDKKNIRIIRKENGGVSSARNRGIQEAIGDYIIFLDGDDYVAPTLIEKLYSLLDEYNVDLMCWGYNTVNKNGTVLIDYFQKYICITEELSGIKALKNIMLEKNMWIWTGSFVVKKELIFQKNISYTENCICGQDLEFTFKLLSKCSHIRFINQVLSYYVVREGSVTNRHDIRKFDSITAIQRACDYMNQASDSELEDIVKVIRQQYLITTYIRTLQTCLMNSAHKNIQILFGELELNYPGLIKEMNAIMKDNKNSCAAELELFKYKRYYFLLNHWLKVKNNGQRIEEYFIKNNYQNIVIYGMGELGYRLYEELHGTKVHIKYAIDRGLVNNKTEIKIIDVQSECENADVVIVSAISAYEEISESLSNRFACPIISLEEVIFSF